LGLAYVHYELSRTYVAGVAQVEVTRSTGQVRVRRVFVAHDCGQIINPDGTRNQIEGNIIQTVSRVVKERVTFDRKNVTSLDWSSYPILTFPEVPDVVIDLIDRPDMAPLGVGEPSAAIVPAAVANATTMPWGSACGRFPSRQRKSGRRCSERDEMRRQATELHVYANSCFRAVGENGWQAWSGAR
jgi:CO/xanthine dehydrogenase Mo-binding subunit